LQRNLVGGDAYRAAGQPVRHALGGSELILGMSQSFVGATLSLARISHALAGAGSVLAAPPMGPWGFSHLAKSSPVLAAARKPLGTSMPFAIIPQWYEKCGLGQVVEEERPSGPWFIPRIQQRHACGGQIGNVSGHGHAVNQG